MSISNDKIRQNSLGYVFILPVAAILLAMVLYPLIYGVYVSFFNTNLVNKWDFVGLKYYKRLITDFLFYKSIGRTFYFTFFTVLGRLVLGVLFAIILSHKHLPYKSLFRSILVLPWFFPDVVIALLWKWLYNPTYGLINHVLTNLHLIDAPVEWLSNMQTVMLSVIAVAVWKGFPFIVVMVLAALQTIPEDLYEAAEIDGCNVFGRFIHVTLPGIMPVLSVATMLQVMWSFKHFTIIWNMTYGGPVDATNVVSIDIYKTGFQYMRFGESSTRAIYVFFIIIIMSLVQQKLKRKDS